MSASVRGRSRLHQLEDSGVTVASAALELVAGSPFAGAYRSEDWFAPDPVDRERAVDLVRALICWVRSKLAWTDTGNQGGCSRPRPSRAAFARRSAGQAAILLWYEFIAEEIRNPRKRAASDRAVRTYSSAFSASTARARRFRCTSRSPQHVCK